MFHVIARNFLDGRSAYKIAALTHAAAWAQAAAAVANGARSVTVKPS